MREPTDDEIDQIGKILACAAAFDNRTIGTADILAWWRVIGHLAPGEAEDAIIAHYSESVDRIMPGHILARVKKIHADRLARTPDALPDADPDDVAAWLAALREGRHRVATGQLEQRPVREAIETTFVYVRSKWSREVAPLRALEPAGADPDHDNARNVLAALPLEQAVEHLTAAREQLAAEGAQYDHRAVAIRAAELATTPHTNEKIGT